MIKERCRCYYAMVPFHSLPRMMIVHLIMTVIFYINAFVSMKGVLQYLSPLSIVKETFLDFNLYFKVIFREFLQMHESSDNTM